MEETRETKNYKCWVYKDTVFWTTNSIDKPSKKNFENNFHSKMVEINITPNWKDQFTIDLVLDKPYYGLIKIQDLQTDQIYFFINSNLTKKLNKGYLVEYDLDLYLTYGFTLFTKAANYGFSMVMVNRMLYPQLFNKNKIETQYANKYYDDRYFSPVEKYKYKPDPVINYEKYSMTSFTRPYNLNWTVIGRCDYIIDSGFVNLQDIEDTNKKFNGKCVFKFSHGARLLKPFVHVYELKNGTYFIFLQPFNSGWGSLDMPNWVIDSDRQIFRNKGQLNNDDSFKLKGMEDFNNGLTAKVSWLANKYVGCFEIPFIEGVIKWVVWDGKYSESGYKTNDIATFGKSNEIILMTIITRDSYNALFKKSYDQSNFAYVGMVNKVVKNSGSFKLQPNTPEANNFLIHFANPYNFTYLPYLDEDFAPLDFWSNANYSFDGNNFTIIQNSTTPHGTKTTIPDLFKNMLNGGNNINNLRGTLNVSSDSYNEYVNSVKATQNSNLQIAKQQMAMGLAQNILGGATSVGTALYSGNVAGAFSSGINSIFGIGNTIMKYQNQQKQIDAQNQAARNTASANNISSSVTSDDIYNKMNVKGHAEVTQGFINIALKYPQTNAEQLEVLNYILQYGIYVGDYLPTDLFFSFMTSESYFLNDFIYIDFEIDDRLLKLVFPNENVTMIEAIKILCKNSFRIWKTTNITFNTLDTYYVF